MKGWGIWISRFWKYEQLWSGRLVNGWINEWIDRWIDVWMNGERDGGMDK